MYRSMLAFFVAWTVLAQASECRVIDAFEVAEVPASMPALTGAPNGDLLVAFSTEWEPSPWGNILEVFVILLHNDGLDHVLPWSADPPIHRIAVKTRWVTQHRRVLERDHNNRHKERAASMRCEG